MLLITDIKLAILGNLKNASNLDTTPSYLDTFFRNNSMTFVLYI